LSDVTEQTDAERPDMGWANADPEAAANPQQFYPMMRDLGVVPMEDMTLITRHEDVVWALRHPDLFSSGSDAIDIGNIRPLIPLQIDPPDHVKFRRLLDPLFAPREMEKLEAEVRTLVVELIDDFVDDGECEFNSAVAIPLPCTVFLRLMGLPLEDLDLFLRFKDGIIRPVAATMADGRAMARETGQEIYAYFEAVIAQRRAQPENDLLSGFIAAEIDGERLTTEDILDISYLFLLAGLDTVTASLGCAVTYLAQHPDRQQALRDDPSRVPAAVEELLRWETPVPGVLRVATQDVDVAGSTIPAGQTVTCLLASANTDALEFPDPELIDFERAANRHLAFGAGLHRCLGSHLARLEMRVALDELHRRVPAYAIKPGETPVYTMGIRGVEYLPLVWASA
jgi:cytochrome P450